jgi:hypothetical protein
VLNPRLPRKSKKIRAAITFQASKSLRNRHGFAAESLA